MIKVTGYYQKAPKYSFIYNVSARVLTVETNLMSEDCVPFEESTGCLVWLNQDELLAEIECICPVEIDSIGFLTRHKIDVLTSTPKFNIEFEDKPVEMFLNDSQVALVFNKNKEAVVKFISSNIHFYVSFDNELLAIEGTNLQLI